MAPLATHQDSDHDVGSSHKLLFVDDDPMVITLLGKTFQGFGRLQFATSGIDALRLAQTFVPDLILLDIEMPGMDGFEVCRALKCNPLLADVPVVFITCHDGGDHELEGLALGGVDFICKPLRPAQVVARARTHLRMKHMSDALRRSAGTDGLTGLANRRQFDDTLSREWRRVERTMSPISMLMVDLDAFKKFNDHYGHLAGDNCLQQVASVIQLAGQRPGDLAARLGGEEFALILPETDARGARAVAGHLLEALDALAIPHAHSPGHPFVSASIGVSSFDADCESWPDHPEPSRHVTPGSCPQVACLLEAADQAMYAAKGAGGRQACFLRIDDLHLPGRAATLPHCCIAADGPPAARTM